MPFSFATGEYNVQGSLSKWFKDNINASLPTWASTFSINYHYPDVPLFDEANGDFAPKFSVTYLGGFEDPAHTEGYTLDPGKRGQQMHAIMEINCWVNVKKAITAADPSGYNYNWDRDLTQMKDMVTALFTANRFVQIVDVYSSTSNPASTGYIVRIDSIENADTPRIDVNPNVRRERLLIHFCWWKRQ